MKIIKNLIVAFVLLSTVFCMSAYASATEYSVKRATEQDEITISGNTSKEEMFSVQILPKDVTPDNVQVDFTKGSQSVFSKTMESDVNGDFNFNVKIPTSGSYIAYVRAISDNAPVSKEFIFTLEGEKESMATTVITALNNGDDVDALNYVKDFFYDDTVLIGYVDKFVNSGELEAYFSSRMKNKGISDYDDLLLEAKKALILTAAKNSDGPGNLKEIMSTYNSILNISSLTNSMSVYTAIKGEYADIESLKIAYNNAVKPSTQSPGSGSTGGGGGGGTNSKGTYTSTSVSTVQIGGNTSQNATPINIKFEDLSSVEWAYKDISELFDKGIINGVSEHLFRPNNQVKREEFVKMIVCAMGLQDERVESAEFADVSTGAWFESYVNIAKKFGISNGIGNNNFGTGIGISRQDMAVMIYNAMKLRGYVPSGQENTFADKSSCAEYANEAIAELCSKGIVGGVGDNMFDPNGEATRAQSAVIINRALSYLD